MSGTERQPRVTWVTLGTYSIKKLPDVTTSHKKSYSKPQVPERKRKRIEKPYQKLIIKLKYLKDYRNNDLHLN